MREEQPYEYMRGMTDREEYLESTIERLRAELETAKGEAEELQATLDGWRVYDSDLAVAQTRAEAAEQDSAALLALLERNIYKDRLDDMPTWTSKGSVSATNANPAPRQL